MVPGMRLLALAALPLGARAAWPGSESCGKPGFKTAPRFHLMEQTGCGENDPNGPVFDPVHGVIHHFFQDHIAAPGGGGPVYGHFVSKDFVNWAQMPVAIWNGIDASVWPPRKTPYDTRAIYTGSAVVVDGAGPEGKGPGVVQIYPGLCTGSKALPGCTTGTLLAQAVPADYAGDELLTNWSKPAYNPIVNATQRDPSTPWKTASGEWRLRTFDSKFYGAASDADLLAGKWYFIGSNKNFSRDECPSFYPLPGPSPGFEAQYATAKAAGELPTHVHKVSGGGDFYQLGTYVDGPAKTTGTWTKTPGWEDTFKFVKMDMGGFYASKDNEYPTKDGGKRRINWGWAQIGGGAQTLPRVVTFNAAIRRLQSFPPDELESLRGPAACDLKDVALQGNESKVLELAPGVSRHSDVVVDFALPSEDTSFGVKVGGVFCNVHFHSDVNTTAPFYEVPVSCAGRTDALRLLPTEKTVQIRVLADASLVEVYFQAGRVAMTIGSNLDNTSQVALVADKAMTLPSTAVYPMRSIWVAPEEVRKAPRVYKDSLVQYV